MHVLQSLKSVQADNGVIILDTGWEQVHVQPVLPRVVRVRFQRGHQWEIGLPTSPAVILQPQSGLRCRVKPAARDAEVPVLQQAGATSPGAPGSGSAGAGAAGAGAASAIPATGEIVLPGQERHAALDQELIELEVGDLRVEVRQNPLRLSFFTADGQPLAAESPRGGVGHDGWRVAARFALQPGERLYGLGETEQRIPGPMQLNHRGEIQRVEHNHLPNPSRLVLPFVISSAGYGIYIDNIFPATWDLGASDPETMAYVADAGQIDYYLMAGDPYEILDAYTQLTGRPALPPRWIFGYMQSKFGYRTRAEVEELIATFRAKGIPIDSVALDLYWFKHMGDISWDTEAFPEPKEFVAGLRQQGVKTVVIEEPYITLPSRLYPEMAARGMLAKHPNGEPFTFQFWTGGVAALADFSNPETRAFWKAQHQPLVESGIAGWWLDLNEPEVHYPTMIHHLGPAQAVHNTESIRMQETVYSALQEFCPDKRPFMMSRSAWAGSQRYGVGLWSGDVATTFKALADQVPLGLSTGLAGFPIWNTDIGGFMGDFPSPELYVRWIQYGAFTPMMRPHGAQQQREPWAFGPEAEAIAKRYIELRYQFIPYWYTYAEEAARTGAPLMRPLFLEFPQDERTAEVGDQFLVGRELLVAPVVEAGATQRRVYLPAGTWYDFWTGQPLQGGRTITVDAPLDHLPLFVRGGSVLPLAPVTPTTDAPLHELTFRLYGAGGGFTLYEDDGDTMAYTQGVYARTTVRTARVDGKLQVEVGAPRGAFAARLPARSITLEAYDVAEPAAVTVDGQAVPRVADAAALGVAGPGYTYDARRRLVIIKLPPATVDRVVQVG
jgi:alpha-glucosidase